MRIINGAGYDPSIKGGYGQKAQQNWKAFKAGNDDGGGGDKQPVSDPFSSMFGGSGGLGDLLGSMFGAMTQPQKPDPVAVQYAEKATASIKTFNQAMANDTFAFVREEMSEWDKDGDGGLNLSEFKDMVSEDLQKSSDKRMDATMKQFDFMQKVASIAMGQGSIEDLFNNPKAPSKEDKNNSGSSVNVPDLLDDLDDLDFSNINTEAKPKETNNSEETKNPKEDKTPVKETDELDFSGLFEDDEDALQELELDLDINKSEETKQTSGNEGLGNIQDKMNDMMNGNFGDISNMDPRDLIKKAQEAGLQQQMAAAFKVQDLNDDGKIDDVERAATVLFTDDLSAQTKAFAKLSFETKFDGILAEPERVAAQQILCEQGNAGVNARSKAVLKKISTEAGLDAKYQQFTQ